MAVERFQELRFVFITGKGGAGKTTVAAALGLSLAQRGRRVLIASCGAKERLSALFGMPPLDSKIQRLAERLWAVRITSDNALREYGAMILKSRRLFDAVFDNKYVKSFFNGVPGLSEWAVLGKAWYHSIEGLESGNPAFDIVLFDAPATGHGLDMLRVPKVIVDIVPPGVLRRDAERAWSMFQDPTQSGVVVVTLPEDMPTNETAELVTALRGELGLPVALLVINQVLPELFSPEERALLLEPRSLDRAKPGDEAVACGVRRAIRERIQAESLFRLDALAVPSVRLPLVLSGAETEDSLRTLAAEHF